jgi:catechol 2,3-dioxygenase-like lactoylglutathione lyase family enzyme
MVRTHGLTHVALAVADAERSLCFYQRVFGMKLVYRGNGFIQAQTPGSRDVLVFVENAPRTGKRGGIAHFGFRLIDPGDIERAAKAVTSAGGKILSKGDFCPGEPYLFFTDPDGYEVEIWYELPTPVDPTP